jgi:hypothetical protein
MLKASGVGDSPVAFVLSVSKAFVLRVSNALGLSASKDEPLRRRMEQRLA